MTTLAELIRAGFRSVAIDVTGVVIDANSRFAQKSEVTDLSNKVTSLETDKADASAVDGKLDKTGTAYKTASIPFVIPNETEATAALTATCAEITSLYDGLVIAFRLPFSNVASTTLDINGFGAKPVYYQATTTSASRIIANSVVILVYETVTVSSGC